MKATEVAGTAMIAAVATSPPDPFAPCRERLEMLVGYLQGEGAASASHAELEQRVSLDGREVLRLAFQGHLDLRAESEPRVEEVKDADGLARGSVEAGHERVLTTVFGEVTVRRLAYRRRSCANLHPAASGHRQGCGRSGAQVRHPPVQGREGQPKAHGHRRCRL